MGSIAFAILRTSVRFANLVSVLRVSDILGGYWQASNGQWYPPETHPNYKPAITTRQSYTPPVGPPAQPIPQAMRMAPYKSVGTAYLFFFFCFGIFGSHQFYLGKINAGAIRLCTLSGLTILLWVDLCTLPRQVQEVNAKIARGEAVT